MVNKFLKTCYFLHITDGRGQMDLTDLSFMLVIGKLILSPGVDWTAICAMIPLIAAQMHQNHIDFKRNSNPTSPSDKT